MSGGLIVTLILLLALIGVVAVGLTRLQPVAAPARPTPQTAASAVAPAGTQAPGGVPTMVGSAADAATQSAIQDVIRRLDDAQTQAIATGNQQVMQPTATAGFYQEQVATNQDLVASGVSDVKLLNLEWGDITVSGDTAMASVYETWQTTFVDGTTQQGRDLNVYTLVKDAQGSGWIVQSDDHPDQPAAPSTPTRSGP